jgi:hypothetical protein
MRRVYTLEPDRIVDHGLQRFETNAIDADVLVIADPELDQPDLASLLEELTAKIRGRPRVAPLTLAREETA